MQYPKYLKFLMGSEKMRKQLQYFLTSKKSITKPTEIKHFNQKNTGINDGVHQPTEMD